MRTRLEAVAVEVGADGTRVAVRDRDGRVEPVAVLPAGTTAPDALDALVGRAAVETADALALVHRASADPAAVTAATAELTGRAAVVRPVPVAVAVVAGTTGPCLVVDDGPAGTELAVVCEGRVRAAERVVCPSPDDLAARVARTARRHGAVEVVLAGGVSWDPALATALDRETGPDREPALDRELDGTACTVRVLAEPATAAVLGALRCVAGAPDRGASDGGPDRDVVDAGTARPRRPVVPVLVAVIGLALLVAGAALGRPPPPPPGPAVASTLVQYGYATDLPSGWEHTGGDPARRRTLLTRDGAPDGVELVSVERSPLGYDSALEPGRARDELGRELARGAAGRGLDGLRDDVVAGRPVLRYRQHGTASSVDWYVLFTGPDELVVGCRHPASGPSRAVTAACAAVVGTVRVVG